MMRELKATGMHPLRVLGVLLLVLCCLSASMVADASSRGSSRSSSGSRSRSSSVRSGASISRYGGHYYAGSSHYYSGSHYDAGSSHYYSGGHYDAGSHYYGGGERWHNGGSGFGLSIGLPLYAYPAYTYLAPDWAVGADVPIYPCAAPPANVTVIVNGSSCNDQMTPPPAPEPPALNAPTGASLPSSDPVAAAPLTAVTVAASPVSPQRANTPITLQASATGGTKLQYQFWLSDPTTHTWSQLQAYSPTPTVTWTPPAVGSYILSVSVKDMLTGKVENVLNWYTVQ